METVVINGITYKVDALGNKTVATDAIGNNGSITNGLGIAPRDTSHDWIKGMENGAAATAGLGALNFGLGIASYMDTKKTAKMQRELMAGQIANNNELMATRKERAGNISGAFGTKSSSAGLV